MILHCPACRAKLRLSDEYQNKRDVWIKCPKCGERFRPQSLDLQSALAPSPQAADGAPPGGRKAVEDLLNRMDLDKLGRRTGDPSEFSLDAIPVVPETPPRTKIWTGITIALVLAMLFGLFMVFKGSAAPPPTQAAESPPPPDYGKDTLLYDIAALRRDVLKLRHVDRTINYRGRESRIYKYFVSNLAPDLCQEITEIHLWSPRTSTGFKMQGVCLDRKQSPATLEVNWNSQLAKIQVSGRPLAVDLPLPRPR